MNILGCKLCHTGRRALVALLVLGLLVLPTIAFVVTVAGTVPALAPQTAEVVAWGPGLPPPLPVPCGFGWGG